MYHDGFSFSGLDSTSLPYLHPCLCPHWSQSISEQLSLCLTDSFKSMQNCSFPKSSPWKIFQETIFYVLKLLNTGEKQE